MTWGFLPNAPERSSPKLCPEVRLSENHSENKAISLIPTPIHQRWEMSKNLDRTFLREWAKTPNLTLEQAVDLALAKN